MELRAIATLKGNPSFQTTAVHVTVKIENIEDRGMTRFELAVMGDVRPPGQSWQPGMVETGPNYHTSAEFNGKLPELSVQRLQVEIRATVSLRLRRIAMSEPEDSSVTALTFTLREEELLTNFRNRPPSGPLAESLINAIGAEIRAFLVSEVRAVLVPAPVLTPPGEPHRIKLDDQHALQLYRQGRLPLRPDQLQRLCERLGVPVPQV